MPGQAFQTWRGTLRAVTVCAAAMLALCGCNALTLFKDSGESKAASAEPYPNLGSVPKRPEVSETKEERRKIADGLVADRDQAKHTDEVLRGGLDNAAAPPPAPLPGTPARGSEDNTGSTAAGDTPAHEDEPRRGFFGRLFHGKD